MKYDAVQRPLRLNHVALVTPPPGGFPPDHPLCRCVWVSFATRDLDGNMVRW